MSTTESTAPMEGGCLCGAIRYQARPDHRDGYYCHCRMCQLAFGNTRATFINLRKDQVTWTRGEPTMFASSRIALRGFCNRCGTPLSFAYNDSQRMDLSVGSLDEPSNVKPVSHFAVESRVRGWHVEDGLPSERFDQYTALVDRWKAAYGDDATPGVETAREQPPSALR